MPHMPYGEGVTYWLFAGGAGLLAAWLFWEISEFAKAMNSENIAIVVQSKRRAAMKAEAETAA